MHLKNILENTIHGLGYELVEFEVTPAKIIRIFIDKDGGVNIGDCEQVSNHLSRLLVVENIVYNRLEVSSPGVERPIKKIEDFIKFKEKTAKVKLKEPINGQKVYQGVIVDVLEQRIIKLKLDSEDELLVDFNLLEKARLVFTTKKLIGNKKGKKK